jgi:outer membrane lipoprotein LolB|tara:strand:+ start:24951 stop:25553 length:603 start_codon:yes stop_codon:yes gene_type:complete
MQRIIFLLLTILVSSCAINKDHSLLNIISWEQHLNKIAQLDHWILQGKIGYRDSKEGGTAWISWDQQGDDFDVRLSGPLGVGATRITGNEYYAQLQRGARQPDTAKSAEELTELLFGWRWPVKQLRFWVRGIAAPSSSKMASSYNRDGTLNSLKQSGWTLQFFDYQEIEDWKLPGNIQGNKGAYQFNLKIKKWLPNEGLR